MSRAPTGATQRAVDRPAEEARRSWRERHPVATAALAVALALVALWGVKLVVVLRSVSSYAQHWAQPRGQSGGLLYVALGDSAAQGIGASDPDKGYVGLLAQRLRERTGQEVLVVNLSRSGARTSDVLESQLPELAAMGIVPDLVTVAIGGNDVRAYDLDHFAAQTELLTAALPPGAYVADVPYFMHATWERDADEAAALVRASVVRQGLRPVALHEALREQGRRAMLTQFAADWFHPNDRGHRVWADAFWARIAPDLAAVPAVP